MVADEDHQHVGDPHGEREEHFGVGEESWADGLQRDHGADEEAGGHAGQAEAEGVMGDLIKRFQGREQGSFGGRSLELELAFLDEIQQARDERYQ